ncbi:hypothetical protein N9N67_04345 [Bacteriovoracaceae bacterium]|nr:hypothetical protein [Bacteriovoracaceae bacterium]
MKNIKRYLFLILLSQTTILSIGFTKVLNCKYTAVKQANDLDYFVNFTVTSPGEVTSGQAKEKEEIKVTGDENFLKVNQQYIQVSCNIGVSVIRKYSINYSLTTNSCPDDQKPHPSQPCARLIYQSSPINPAIGYSKPDNETAIYKLIDFKFYLKNSSGTSSLYDGQGNVQTHNVDDLCYINFRKIYPTAIDDLAANLLETIEISKGIDCIPLTNTSEDRMGAHERNKRGKNH